ncbi:hypothetical protein EDB89DRAFT_1970291, partial [Lactarius sanguifluus]
MAQLRSLSLHFPSTANSLATTPQSGKHVVLPSLTRLNFRGTAEYLEVLVARIDAPCLRDIEVTFFDKLIVEVSKLGKFIDRIEIHKSHRQAHILFSERAISISLIQPGTPTCLKLQLFCEPLSEQLLFMTRVCNHLSASLFNVEGLRISTTRPPGQGDSEYGGWRDLLNSFTSVKWFHVAGNLSTNIVHDLQLPDRGCETVLPSLYTLYIAQPGPH